MPVGVSKKALREWPAQGAGYGPAIRGGFGPPKSPRFIEQTKARRHFAAFGLLLIKELKRSRKDLDGFRYTTKMPATLG